METIFNHEPSGKRRTREGLLEPVSTKRKMTPASRMPPTARNLTLIAYRIRWLSDSNRGKADCAENIARGGRCGSGKVLAIGIPILIHLFALSVTFAFFLS